MLKFFFESLFSMVHPIGIELKLNSKYAPKFFLKLIVLRIWILDLFIFNENSKG